MRVTILGTGTSTGVPVIGCDCTVCTSVDPKDQRTRSSILIETDSEKRAVVDTGPEFRLQMIREKVRSLDAVFYTHLHADHCHGFDDLRAFSFREKKSLDVFMVEEFAAEFRQRFSYAFEETGYKGIKPQVNMLYPEEHELFEWAGLGVDMGRAEHGGIRTSIFKFDRFLYATDFKEFSPELIDSWRGSIDVMVASGVHFGKHETHSTIQETVELIKELEVDRGYITHLSHLVDYKRDAERLPVGISFAYDGLSFSV